MLSERIYPIKINELELTGVPKSKVMTELVVKPKLPQSSIPKFSGNLQGWVTFKDTFLSLVGDRQPFLTFKSFTIWYQLLMGMQKESYSIYL